MLERNFVKLSKILDDGIVLQDDFHARVQDSTGEWAKATIITNS
jgi:hypothetical protein